jgi:hypothetical protein
MKIDSIESLGDNLYTYANNLSSFIDERIYKTKDHDQEPKRFYYLILHKLRNLIDTSSLLIKNMGRKPHFIDSIQLLLRTCLLDAINLIYVFDAESDSKQQLHRINHIMSDHVKSMFNSENEEKVKAEIIATYPTYFDDGKIKAIYKDNLTARRMISQLYNEDLKPFAQDLADIYAIFSKVEHNGVFSFDLLHKNYLEAGHRQSTGIILDSLSNIALVINIALNTWLEDENEQYTKLLSFLEDLDGYKETYLNTTSNNGNPII